MTATAAAQDRGRAEVRRDTLVGGTAILMWSTP